MTSKTTVLERYKSKYLYYIYNYINKKSLYILNTGIEPVNFKLFLLTYLGSASGCDFVLGRRAFACI